MAWQPRTVFLCGALVGLGTFALQAQSAQITSQTPQPSAVSHPPEHFVGLWAYNAAESVNAATGRPEQAPRSATTNRAGGGGRGAGGGAMPPSRPSDGGDGRYAGFGNSGNNVGPTVAMIQENRSLRRDLMEVPEELT